MKLITFPRKIRVVVACASIAAVCFFSGSIYGQGQCLTNETDSSEITISMKRDGFPCGTVPLNDKDLSGCPAYSISIAGDGTVTYEGVSGVKTKGKRTFRISAEQVSRLLADFERIKFFQLQDKYTEKRLADGAVETIDHSNGTTITLKIGNKIKSVFNFYGAPEELNALQEKLNQISKDLQR